ncbi:PA0069 family radical SAM protein [Silvimonas sp. JCM 19000]
MSIQRGRGTAINPDNRFQSQRYQAEDDGWIPDEPGRPATTVQWLPARNILTRNSSPDIPFDRSVNPYQGCEHGCIYCFARPSHAYWDLSPGLDFETRLIAKPNAAQLLRERFMQRGYKPAPLCLGSNTDAYQPLERDAKLSRAILEVLLEARHPVYMLTKNALIERDIDLLQDLAAHNLVSVNVSITTLDRDLARVMEPRASQPLRRVQTVRTLVEAGIPTGVLAAPMIPALNDHELERILTAAKAAGASSAGYTLLRLPHELTQLFEDWLRNHYPDRADHVLNLVRDTREGALYNSDWGQRMKGTGQYAQMITQRFRLAIQKLGLNQGRPDLDCTLFRAPGQQGHLF